MTLSTDYHKQNQTLLWNRSKSDLYLLLMYDFNLLSESSLSYQRLFFPLLAMLKWLEWKRSCLEVVYHQHSTDTHLQLTQKQKCDAKKWRTESSQDSSELRVPLRYEIVKAFNITNIKIYNYFNNILAPSGAVFDQIVLNAFYGAQNHIMKFQLKCG